MSEFALYSYFRSSASYRVRIALNLKSIPYEYKAVHLLNQGGEQHQEAYRQLNPSHQVPTLVHQGRAIGQSMAIIEYLDQLKPMPRLFPADAYQRALVIQACEIINSGIQPLHNLNVLQELEKQFGANQTKKNEWSAHWLEHGLSTLEAFIAPHAGQYCFGNAVSAADCFIVPHFHSCSRYGVSLTPYPTLTRIAASCKDLAPFKQAAPEVQPDTPKTP